MVKFNDTHKEEMGGEYFDFGIHKVKIMLVEFGETEDKEPREFVDFTVTDETETKEAKARLWFTTDKAIKYTFNIIRGIFVHNSAEDKKQKIREKVDAVKDTKELNELCQLLVGKDAWLEVSEDPNRTYQDEKTGEQRPSINRNITGYEPTPKKVSAPAPATAAPAPKSDSDDEVMADF